jgi:hypothetical protein
MPCRGPTGPLPDAAADARSCIGVLLAPGVVEHIWEPLRISFRAELDKRLHVVGALPDLKLQIGLRHRRPLADVS